MRVFLFFCIALPSAWAAVCTSEEYCPAGWAVKRVGKEYSALTCDPMDSTRKCPKPYTCVASHCQINFCCANKKMLERVAAEQALREEANNDNDEDDEEDNKRGKEEINAEDEL